MVSSKKMRAALALTLALVPVARPREAGAVWNTALGARASHQSKTCGLIAHMFSPAAPAWLRDYIRTSCAQECADDRSLVDVVIISKTNAASLLSKGEVCEGATFSVLNEDAGPIANPPKAVLQVILQPRGPDRFDFVVRVAGYSTSQGAHGIMLCGEDSGRAVYRGGAWHLKESLD